MTKQEDIKKINYKPTVEWYKERMYTIVDKSSDIYKKYIPGEKSVNSKELYEKFSDLSKKAKKLDDAIDSLSSAERIPVDKEKQPTVSWAVSNMDPGSNGEFVSYELYRSLSLQVEDEKKSVDLEWLLDNTTSDSQSNSDLICYKYGLSSKSEYSTLRTNRDSLGDFYSKIGSDLKNAVRDWAEEEFYVQQILNFSNEFLSKTTDSRYIPWNFKSDVRRKLVEYDDIGKFLSQYTDLVEDISESADLIPSSPLQLARDFFDALDGKAESDNNFFNRINDIFGFNYTADLVCCFTAWSSKIDTKTLSAIRMMLSIVANGLSVDYGKLINTLLAIINNLFKNIIGPQLIALIDSVFQLIANPIREWLNTNDETWKRIFLCTPIDELINEYVLGGIEYLKNKLIDKLDKLVKQFEIEAEFEEGKLTIFEKNKKLNILIGILDIIIDSVGKLSYCGFNEQNTANNIIRDINGSNILPSWDYTYPKEDRPNRYNSFTKEVVTVENYLDQETGENEIFENKEIVIVDGIGSSKIDISKVNIDDCLRKISDDDVFSVQKWMDDLKGESSEGMNV